MKKSFTILELIIAIIIVAVLVTVGLPVYRNVIENANVKVCQSNLILLDAALQNYMIEFDTIPGEISKIPVEYIEDAYAEILREGGWRLKLAYAIADWQKSGYAHAQPALENLVGHNLSILTCPSDATPPNQGGVSYGINQAIIGLSYNEMQNIDPETIFIADCNFNEFASEQELDFRHRSFMILGEENFAQGITRSRVNPGVEVHDNGNHFGWDKGKRVGQSGNNPGRGQSGNNPHGGN
ncbi:MAG: hypothetical protein ISS27_02360 [Candidatus Omnitrophica bacterium]|nr:hypothetical protein [Candidatus Omnitrophota bacterium]